MLQHHLTIGGETPIAGSTRPIQLGLRKYRHICREIFATRGRWREL